MKLGAWIHDFSDEAAERQFIAAGQAGIASVRGYSVDYSRKVAPWVKRSGMTLLAGIHIDEKRLVEDWRSQVKLDELERTLELDCPLEAVCVGNELREGGDGWESRRFTARLSFSLARVVEEMKTWMAKRGVSAPLTYAMEGIVFDASGQFLDHLWPLIDALDIVSINHYPLTVAQWRDFTAFEANAAFLRESRPWRLQISRYESHLRSVLEATAASGKPVMLSEMGFPSGVGYRINGKIGTNDHVRPESDNEAFAARMMEYVSILASASRDYGGRLTAAYWYEWWDNHYHQKIWNVEQSPIHTCFGLCEYDGTPKLDIPALVKRAAADR